ncbi:hypothetical protein PIROE2DRAFT_12392 [Piromyces sp. E2]|nr:hypothetical protein PIROE2DRAFT_12392 [Piromyces sp. E2]|eukprot:OUM61571.1 hypothetical protein PIROE2DRAFT_12392 [Piromyces sp. E2]
MSKNDVLNLDVEKFKTKDDCPDYSTGFDEENNYCKFHFFCKNETCSTVDEKGYVEFDNKTYKAYTCSFSGSPILGDISCTSDSECLTNNCYKNHCHRKNAMPRIECIVQCQYDNQTSTYKPAMYCNKAENEDCRRDEECFSNQCIHSKENSTRYYCGPEIPVKDGSFSIYVIIILPIVLLILCFMFCGFDGEYKTDNNYFDYGGGSGGGCDCGGE